MKTIKALIQEINPDRLSDNWTWADELLAVALRTTGRDGNPYEYRAFDDSRRDEWIAITTAAERGDKKALREVAAFIREFVSNL